MVVFVQACVGRKTQIGELVEIGGKTQTTCFPVPATLLLHKTSTQSITQFIGSGIVLNPSVSQMINIIKHQNHSL